MKEKVVKFLNEHEYELTLKDLNNIEVKYNKDSCYFFVTFDGFYYSYGFDLFYVDRIFGIGTIGKEYRFNGEYKIRQPHFKDLKVSQEVVDYVEKEIKAAVKENRVIYE